MWVTGGSVRASPGRIPPVLDSIRATRFPQLLMKVVPRFEPVGVTVSLTYLTAILWFPALFLL
jgi:hypothetical protein